jgi:hypothetical protein
MRVYGKSPEAESKRQVFSAFESRPSLTLEQVYGAITYYLSHRDEVEQYLRRQEGEWAKWRAPERTAAQRRR